MSALMDFAALKKLPLEHLRRHGVTDDERGGIHFLYGSDGRARIRKSAETAHPTFWATGDTRPMRAYGHHLTAQFMRGKSHDLLIVEGESDALTLWLHRVPALGIPGATMAHTLQQGDVMWADRALVVREPGAAGTQFVLAVAKRFRELGYAGKILKISLAPHKDPSDLHVAVVGDRTQFVDALDAAIAHGVDIISHDNETASRALTGAEFLAGSDDVEHLIEGLLPRGGSAIVGGKKKVGKGVLLLNMARAVARGETFLGRRCRQGTVLYLSLDESPSITRDRATTLGITANDPIVWFAARTRPHDWERWLRDLVAEHRPALLIADTLVKLAGIQKIEDYSAWNEAYKPLYALADEYGCAFVGSAHNRKAGEINPDAIAGSVSATGGVDTIVVIERLPDNRRMIETEQRHGEDLTKCALLMNPDTLELSIGAEAWLLRRRAIERKILHVLEVSGAGREQIIAATACRALDVKISLAAMIDAGMIRRAGRGVSRDPFIYSVAGPDIYDEENRDQDPRKPRHIKDISWSQKSNSIDGTKTDQQGPRNSSSSPGPDSADQDRTNPDQAGPRNDEVVEL